jgi:hypothetical protein
MAGLEPECRNECIDRRVQCPRELIRNALTSLILEKGYEHVTVQDICDRADVGRPTFYEPSRQGRAPAQRVR